MSAHVLMNLLNELRKCGFHNKLEKRPIFPFSPCIDDIVLNLFIFWSFSNIGFWRKTEYNLSW